MSCLLCETLTCIGTWRLRSEYNGCQDWDFVLRLSEKTSAIAHIPQVLYHWRVITGSVSEDLGAKPYVENASRLAREDALRRRGLVGELIPVQNLPGYHRVRYRLQGNPLISIIIPSKDNEVVLSQCIDSILNLTTYRNFELIVMDNGSTKPAALRYLSSLSSNSRIRVVPHDKPFNYSEINNAGVREAAGDLLLFLNDDTEVISPGWIEYMGAYAQLRHVGAVGAKLLYPGGQLVQHVGLLNLADGPGHGLLKSPRDEAGPFARNLLEFNWIAVTGACLMVSKQKFDVVGGFDETFPVAYNDVELCFRLIAHGLYNVVCPSVELIHHESLSRGVDTLDIQKLSRLKDEKLRLYAKHPDLYMRDPFYNPNLAANDVHFSLPH